MKRSVLSENLFRNVFLTFALLTLTTANAQAQTQPCVETNGVKFIMPPRLDGGLDVLDTFTNGIGGIVLADDFFCNTAGPITDIHLWGSWLSDVLGDVTNVWIGIYNDVPAVTNFVGGQVTPSHPGTNLLWQQTFGPGQFSEGIYGSGNEVFFDPSKNILIGSETNAYYYCFYPTNPFVQQGTANRPTNYWLAVYAKVGVLQPQNTQGVYGWKTSISNYNDAAVWSAVQPGTGLPVGNWQSMTNPQTFQPVNLAFLLTTPTNAPPPPTQCVETNGVKYIQPPNLDGGFDVWNDGPWMLADDFVCTNPGPITDIHIWGSWLNNLVGTNALTFWLGIYDDVPLGPTNTVYSHPGNLLWQQWFGPGQYAENLYGSGSEGFLDPGPPLIIGADSQAWYYCFNPTNPLVQLGSTAGQKTYWLAVYAQPPAGANFQYGWKTAQIVKNDVSVHAPWPGTPPIGNPGWTPTTLPTGAPLDLAFKLNTSTNRCPGASISCQPDTFAECGSAWTFGPTNVIDQCCSNWVTYSDTTNVLGPCQVQYTRTWFLYDCIGFEGFCSQNVFVEDTTLPVFTSFPTNLVAYTCDTNIAVFWSVTATDACSSVTITSAPPSGTSFPGHSTNIVWVTARDVCGNSMNESFTLTVLQPAIDRLSIRYIYVTNNVYSNLVVLTWTNGYLQMQTNSLGVGLKTNWVDVPGATSPYTNTTSLPLKFYRLWCN